MKKIICILFLILMGVGIASAADLGTAIDPIYLGVGARPLGMGKSYVAVAEDAEGLLLNPAGLAKFSGGRVTSMYANLMGDASYMVVAGGIPVGDSMGIGAGFASVSVGDILLSDSDNNPLGSATYTNGVLFLSMAADLQKDRIMAPLLPNKGADLLIGTNIKFFMLNSSGSDLVEDGNGSGINMDIGLLYAPKNKNFAIGFNVQNALPPSIGKITYKSGAEDELPTVFKVGTKFKILGEAPALNVSSQKLNLLVDADFCRWGTGLHIGTEYQPADWLTLRAGLDQDASPSKASMNPTFGVGLKYSGFSFDYAYHAYGDSADNTTQFFSISVAMDEIGNLANVERTEKVAKEEPKNKKASKDKKTNETGGDDSSDGGVYQLPEEYQNLAF